MPRPAVLFLIILFFQAVAAQEPDTHERIRKAYAERNYLAAAAELRELEIENPAVFNANNYDYLLARISEKIGDTASAMARYQSVADRNSVLKEYALWHLSRLARASGGLMLERIYLQELTAFSTDSSLFHPASGRLAQSWFDSGNYDLAIRAGEQPSSRPANKPGRGTATDVVRERQVFLAEAYLRAGNTARAKDLFSAVTTEIPNPEQPDDFALAGVRGLDDIEAAGTTGLADHEHFKRASIYQFNRDFPRARVHYAAIINGHRTSGLVADSIFQTGRGYVQQNDFTEALKWFERVLEQFPNHSISGETLLQTASAYARVGKYREAVTRYKKYIEKYPDGERLDRAYLNVIDILRDQREETDAIKWTEAIRQKFRDKQPEALATFAKARIHLARTDWQNALTTLNGMETFPDLGGATAPGGTSVAEVRFLRAFSLESLRHYPEAIEVYLSIPDGRNEYYGWRATEHLRLMASDASASAFITAKAEALRDQQPKDADAVRKDLQALLRLTDKPDERDKLLQSLRAVYAGLPAYREPKFKLAKIGRQAPVVKEPAPIADRRKSIADELLFLGLYDEAAPELEASAGSATDSYTLAAIHTRGDLAFRGSAFIESVWKMPADYQIDLIPAEVLELTYPAPYADALIKYAPQRNVDSRFLLAIMRQESRFRPDVKSYAAARGLMQFISTTAARTAAELGRENFRQEDLYDPSTAILFGAHYTGNLFRLFPNQMPAVAASYNGGEDNMHRWLMRAKSDEPDRYVSEIAYSQSKDYANRVMANYRMYQALYDEDLKRR